MEWQIDICQTPWVCHKVAETRAKTGFVKASAIWSSAGMCATMSVLDSTFSCTKIRQAPYAWCGCEVQDCVTI